MARELAAIRESCPDATVVRLGGDEFVVVVPGVDTAPWLPRLQLAMDRIAAMPMSGISCGIACGIATTADLHGGVGSGRPLFRLADAVLYRAKLAGSSRPVRAGEAVSVEQHRVHRVSTERARLAWARDERAVVELKGAVNAFARVVDAAAWWISTVEPGSDEFVVADRHIVRDRRQEDGRDIAAVGETYPVSDYPWSREVLDGGHFWVGLHDLDADPAEQAVLAELGYVGNLVAGVRGGDGRGWLIEIFADPETAAIDRMGPQLLGLVLSVGA